MPWFLPQYQLNQFTCGSSMPDDVERQVAEPEHVLHLLGREALEDPRGDLDVLCAHTGEEPLGVVLEAVGGLEHLPGSCRTT